MPSTSSSGHHLASYLDGEYSLHNGRRGNSSSHRSESEPLLLHNGSQYYTSGPEYSRQDIVVDSAGGISIGPDVRRERILPMDADFPVIEESSLDHSYHADVEHSGRPFHSQYGRPGSPAGHASLRSASAVERIVSLPFPNVRTTLSEPDYVRHDERDDIIRELRGTVSRLEKRVLGLERERGDLLEAGRRAADESNLLKKEITRLSKLLDEERHAMQLNLKSEEMKRREAFELVDLQRKLLLLKDEEIQQLSHLAAAHREQIFILHSHMGSVEMNNILDENFDIRRIDTGSLDPDARHRVMELSRTNNLHSHIDLTVPRNIDKSKAIYVGSRSTAYAIDAADGVLDGKYNGREIMVPVERVTKSTGYGQPRSSNSSVSGRSTDKVADLRRQLNAARQEREALGHVYRR